MPSKPQFVGERLSLENRVEYVRGVTYKAAVDLHEELDDSSYILLRANNIQDGELRFDDVQYVDRSKAKSKQLLRRGDILFCASSGSKGLVGKAAMVRESMPVTFGAFCCVLRPKENEAEYLGHYFQSRQYRRAIEEACSGSNINNLKAANFLSLVVPRYDDDSTRTISALFDSIDAQIRQAKDQITSLDSLIKSRFVEVFGDPVSNSKNWQTRNLKSIGNLKNGVNFKSVDNGFEIKCLGVGDFKDRYSIGDMSLIGEVALNGKPNDNQMLKDGDVVFVRSNGNKALVGRCLAVFPGDEKLTFSGFCIRFRIESDDINLDYFLNCMKSDSMRKSMAGRGANIQNLSQAILSKLAIPVPPLELQREFAAFSSQVDKSRFAGQLSALRLTRYG